MRTIALAFTVFSFAVSTSSGAEIHKSNKTAQARKELAVAWYFKGLKDNCETTDFPEIDLNVPPKGGTVCMRSGMKPVSHIWNGNGRTEHCIGTRVRGTWVIYIPFGSFTGLDSMQFTVKIRPPRTYEAKISVEAGEETAAGSAPLEPQKAGLVPMCPALVS
jgi:hypothetical protein